MAAEVELKDMVQDILSNVTSGDPTTTADSDVSQMVATAGKIGDAGRVLLANSTTAIFETLSGSGGTGSQSLSTNSGETTTAMATLETPTPTTTTSPTIFAVVGNPSVAAEFEVMLRHLTNMRWLLPTAFILALLALLFAILWGRRVWAAREFRREVRMLKEETAQLHARMLEVKKIVER